MVLHYGIGVAVTRSVLILSWLRSQFNGFPQSRATSFLWDGASEQSDCGKMLPAGYLLVCGVNMATKKKNAIPHRDRKNPGSRERYREAKHARNMERGPQFWSEKLKEWVR